MSLITPSRRGFLLGLTGLLAAPAIVRAASLMPVKVIKPEQFRWDGQMGETAIWNAPLTDAEIQALAGGLSPMLVRPGQLDFYAPMWRAS